jgi:hypothetical protein
MDQGAFCLTLHAHRQINEIEKFLTAQSALLLAITRMLIAKGMLTKLDLFSDLGRRSSEAPLPP